VSLKLVWLPGIAAFLLAACGEGPAERPDEQGVGLPDFGLREDVAPPPTDGSPPPDGAVPDGQPPQSHSTIYPTGVTLSPLSPNVKARLRQIAARAPRAGRVFAKLGASMTVSTSFMHCFAGTKVALGQHGGLAPAIQHFNKDLGGGVTPFDRKSLCATVGWAALHALKGTPSPAEQEVNAISPRFTLVTYGTNDIGYKNIHGYADDMLDLADLLMGKGVIPVLSSIPPRDDSVAADLEVPRYNAVVRAVAQARQVPFIDMHRELVKLSDHGVGSDGVHLTTYSGGACQLTAAGLAAGYNLRNLRTLQTLQRAKQAVVDDAPAPDPPGPARKGSGMKQDPIVVEGFPFVDRRDTKGWTQRVINSYSGCSATQDESGPEVLYRLVLSKPTKIRAYVFDRGSVDIDLHLLDSSASGGGCIKRDHKQLDAALQPGTYHFALDTFVNGGQEMAGEYLFVLLRE
jgi:GDSL-like Lipase/Acylhydrolase family